MTDYHRTPSMMRSSETWIARLMSEFAPAALITDMEMNVLRFNKEAARVLRRLGEPDGALSVRLDVLESASGFEDCRRRLAQQGRFRVERKYTGSLEPVWIEWLAREFVHDNSSHCLWTGYDVTRWKKSEVALLFNELRLEALLTLGRMTDAPAQDLLRLAQQAALGLVRSSAGYIAMVDDREQEVTLSVWARNGELQAEDDAQKAPRFGMDSARPWANVLRQRRTVTVNPPSHVRRCGEPSVCRHALRHMSVPVFDENRLVLIAGVGDKEEDYDEQDEQQLSLFMSGVWPFVKRSQSMPNSRSLR